MGAQKTKGYTRYEVDQGAQLRLNDELRKGHVQIDEWLKKNKLPRLPLPQVCGYIPLVRHLSQKLRAKPGEAAAPVVPVPLSFQGPPPEVGPPPSSSFSSSTSTSSSSSSSSSSLSAPPPSREEKEVQDQEEGQEEEVEPLESLLGEAEEAGGEEEEGEQQQQEEEGE